MPRLFLVFAAFFIIFAYAHLSSAIELPMQPQEAEEGAPEPAIVRELEYRLKTNQMFTKAASQIVASTGVKEAVSYLKMSEAAAREAFMHYGAGEYEFALEDISESTRMAIYAIIMATGTDKSLRDIAITEEFLLNDSREHARKEKLIQKGTIEVDTFIMTAERLMFDKENAVAREKLEEAKKLLASSKKSIASENYDAALSEINMAYTLATESVKTIKSEEGATITFPRTTFASVKEEIKYELKKNATYFFFAGQVVKNNDENRNTQIKEARGIRDAAVKDMEGGDERRAVEGLRTSTKLLISIIRDAVNN